jgi:hypothetical protein
LELKNLKRSGLGWCFVVLVLVLGAGVEFVACGSGTDSSPGKGTGSSSGSSGAGVGYDADATIGSGSGSGADGSGGADANGGFDAGSPGASSGTGGSASSSGSASGGGAGGSGSSSGIASDGGSEGSGSSGGSGGVSGVLTNRYDNARTGVQPAETALTPATVGSPGRFGLLFSLPVDGTIQAQPLYARGVTIGGVMHDVVFVATEHNTVYAWDAESATQTGPLWQASMGPAAPFAGAPWTCADLIPYSGVSATPVLDPVGGTIYVLAQTLESGAYHHKLHALDWATGSERQHSPVEITPPSADWSPTNHFSRVGLLLTNGVVYGAFGSHCDLAPYHGWVVAYDAQSLALKGFFETGLSGGIWQSGQGLSTDDKGNVYWTAGVSSAGQAGCSSTDLCQSVGSVSLGGGGLTLGHSWTLGKVAGTDLDLTTAVVLGGGLGFVSGKDGFMHVLNAANLQHVQDVQVSPVINASGTGGHVHGGPVYWDSPTGPLLYVWPEATPLGVYSVTSSGMSAMPLAQNSSRRPSHPGPIITVSSNGKMPGTGILWATMATTDGVDTWHGIFPGTLYAFDAETVSKMIWNSDASAADALGMFAKFCPPTVANGRVYVGTATTTDALRVYGLH